MKPTKQSWVLAGGLISAMGASVCCLGPFLALALGATGFAASAWFSAWRPYFLVAAFGLLATAWYLTYRRSRSEYADGVACAPFTNRKIPKIALWVVTAIAVPAALFPLLVPWGLVASNTTSVAGAMQVRVRIPTMDCIACAKGIEATLRRHPGVQRADVDYDSKNALIVFDPMMTTAAQIVAAIDNSGFKAELAANL